MSNSVANPDRPVNRNRQRQMANYQAEHFSWSCTDAGVATITLNRPERKNPLTFDSYAELRDLFRALSYADDVKTVIITGAGGNFSSGGDVHEIIGPLVGMTMPDLLEFTRMTGDLVLAMRKCPQPIIASIEGICAGAGAIMALSSDFRLASPTAKTAFLFVRVGLAGCDMAACTMLPRLVGQGRASDLLFTGRSLGAEEGLSWGFYNRVHDTDSILAEAGKLAQSIAQGPSFAHAMTKNMLHQEWSMSVEQALEAEAQAQAICMQTQDFSRAYEAFAAKQSPQFKGN